MTPPARAQAQASRGPCASERHPGITTVARRRRERSREHARLLSGRGDLNATARVWRERAWRPRGCRDGERRVRLCRSCARALCCGPPRRRPGPVASGVGRGGCGRRETALALIRPCAGLGALRLVRKAKKPEIYIDKHIRVRVISNKFTPLSPSLF